MAEPVKASAKRQTLAADLGNVGRGAPLHSAFGMPDSPPRRTVDQGLEFLIRPGRVALLLFGVAVIFTALSLVGEAVQGDEARVGALLSYLFGLDREGNVSTFYSALLLAQCSLLLYVIYRSNKLSNGRHTLYWLGLVIVFAYLAVDEAARLHEVPSGVIREYLLTFQSGPADVFIPTPWVLPAGLAVLVMGALYLRFLFALPRKSALLFAGAGFVYLSGAIFFEMLAWHHRFAIGGLDYADHASDVGYVLLTAIEELLEMSGAVLFIYGLLSYMARELPVARIRVAVPTLPRDAPRDDGQAL